MRRIPRTTLLAVLALAGLATIGRSQEPALPVSPAPVVAQGAAPSSAAQFERGKPRKVVDSLGWVFGIPKKIILWDRRASNHRVSPETEQRLAQYLDTNGLMTTKVRINQYDPIGEWNRLRTNREVGAGWRYTVGAFDTLVYTLVPGRVFGSDYYNPYTDSVYVYSDIPCLAQEQASYARMVHSRTYRGSYAAFSSLPVVQLWPEKESKSDVIDYTLAFGTIDEQREARRVFYAEYGAEVGNQAALVLGSNLPLTLAGAGIGHLAAYRSTASSPEPAPGATPNTEFTAQQVDGTGPATLRR